MTSIFANVHERSWRFIALAVAGVFVLVAALNISVRYDRPFYDAVYQSTHHLVTPVLVSAGLLTVVIVSGLAVYGKVPFSEFGWRRASLVPGLAATAVLWIAMQLVELFATLITNGHFQLSPSWSAIGWSAVIGVLLGQAIGTAASEETFFRGFLLPQLRLKFTQLGAGVAVGLAIALSQMLFALNHVPNLVLGSSGQGTDFSDIVVQLAVDFAVGSLFAAVYIRTRNLFLVMGIHALLDARTSVVVTPIDTATVVLGLTVIILLSTFASSSVVRVLSGGPSPVA